MLTKKSFSLDVHKLYLSRTQKRVLRRMNEFLLYDVKPKKSIREEGHEVLIEHIGTESETANGGTVDRFIASATNLNSDMSKGSAAVCYCKTESSNRPKEEASRKKKVIRRERAFERMRTKGINVEEVIKKRAEKEQLRRRTLESFLLPYDEKKFKHRLEIRLVKLHSQEFDATLEGSFAVYEKYQTIVHKDDHCSRRGYLNFLANSPLFDDKDASSSPKAYESFRDVEDVKALLRRRDIYSKASKSIELGSYHQQYVLDGRIIAVGVVDILPRCFSAKYFYYDPDFSFLSLGIYAALREIAFTRELAKERPELHYYYMGYYIDSCPKMRYKGCFRPSDLLCDHSFTWVPLDECVRKLRTTEEKAVAFAPDKSPPEQIDVGCAMPYSLLKTHPEFTEKEDFMEEYAELVGPIAKEMLLVRT